MAAEHTKSGPVATHAAREAIHKAAYKLPEAEVRILAWIVALLPVERLAEAQRVGTLDGYEPEGGPRVELPPTTSEQAARADVLAALRAVGLAIGLPQLRGRKRGVR